MHSFVQGLRYAARLLRKSPGFSFAAIVVLALGIGANTAVFSLVNAVLLRPLPFPHPEQLMRVGVANSGDPQDPGSFGNADFLAWRDQQKSFSYVAAIDRETFTYSNGDQPQRVRGAWVSQQFFDVLGVRPLLGRTF